jgi:dihydroorotate dehydrogenase (fumarate)
VIALVSYLSTRTYRYVLKPILFRQKPDAVHTKLLTIGTKAQNSRSLMYLINKVWAYNNAAYLCQTVNNISFRNPVGLSAGFDKNCELVALTKAIGFGFMEGGSVTHKPCSGNPRPWFYRLPKSKSIVVHAGLANDGARAVISRLKHYSADQLKNYPLNISIAKTNSKKTCDDTEAIADYIASLKAFERARIATMYTLNISCPNTYGGEPFTTPDRLKKLLTAVDTLDIAKPLFIKMPSDLSWPDFKKLLDVASNYSVAGVTISNLAKDRGQADLMDPLPDSIKGNLSGKPVEQKSNYLISKTYHYYGKRFTIIGVGGIFNAHDAYAKICLGASLVELITGMIFEGPQLIGQINRDLVRLARQDGFSHISQAIGSKIQTINA